MPSVCFVLIVRRVKADLARLYSEAMRVGLGPGVLMSYILQGLVHPARKVREVRSEIFSLQET